MQTPQWFFNASDRYNDFDRSTKHFELEYAAISTNDTRVDADLFQPVEANAGRLRWSTMEAAIGEAAYMTGLEKNSDFVVGAAFAPMIENRNDNDWSPNLISLDAGRVYNNSASFYVQKVWSLRSPAPSS
jgi:alpha-N-arabinofuranosidase